MLHLANDYIRNNVIVGHSPQASTITQQTFSLIQCNNIKVELEKDCNSYIYSSLISFIDALNGLQNGFYSWPTVKLYYSVFYALRAYLGLNDICIFYVGTKAFNINLNNQTNANKISGTTHKVVMELFKQNFQNHVLLTQDIDQAHPFDWLTYLREYSNYKNPRFCEPNIPSHFTRIDSMNLKNALIAYNQDKNYLYAFDKDHAIIAYPLEIIKSVLHIYTNKGLTFDEVDLENIKEALSCINGTTGYFDSILD
ncbi:MAG: hypothetical protein Sw2PiBPW_00660 [Shewanella algae]